MPNDKKPTAELMRYSNENPLKSIMFKDKEGLWVRYKDVQKLKDRLAELEAENKKLRLGYTGMANTLARCSQIIQPEDYPTTYDEIDSAMEDADRTLALTHFEIKKCKNGWNIFDKPQALQHKGEAK